MPREIKSKKSKASGIGEGPWEFNEGWLCRVCIAWKGDTWTANFWVSSKCRSTWRKSFDEDSLATLAESIKNLGIFQPIVVRKQKNKYQIVAGERRYRAAMIAGLKTVPVIVKKYNTEEMTEVLL